MKKEESLKKIQLLLQLLSPKKTSKQKIDILNQLETIQGYELVFILSLIMRSHFSGRLTIVNEENLLSGINFIYGDIVKVDYPDQENLIGKLIVENEMLSKFEIQEIIEKTGGARLGEYLINQGHITEAQLRKILFKQTSSRLSKYLTSVSIRLEFTFESESHESVLMNRIDYHDLLYSWTNRLFQDSWLIEYGDYYQNCIFMSQIDADQLQLLKDYSDVYDLAFKMSQLKKNKLNYNELFKLAHTTRTHFFRLLHFMVLSGLVAVERNREVAATELDDDSKIEILSELESDLQKVRSFILHKKYFEAFGLMNKYASFMRTHPRVEFYFIWIKLTGALYHRHLIDIKKFDSDFKMIDPAKQNLADYYYVRSLIHKLLNEDDDSLYAYQKACLEDPQLARFPIHKNDENFLKETLSKIFKIK